MRTKVFGFLVLLSLIVCGNASAAILVFSSSGGKFTTKSTLEAARTAPDTANKIVVVTSALTQAQSNIVAAWPADRKLKFEVGGSIANSTAFPIVGDFEGTDGCFKGAGTVTFGDATRPAKVTPRPEWWGAVTTSYGVTTYAATNKAAINKAVASIAYWGGKVAFRKGLYYVNGVIPITMNGIIFEGESSSATALTPGTHITTTSTTEDVISVLDSTQAVEGFELRNIVLTGNSSGTTGHCFSVKATNRNAISLIKIINSHFLGAAEHGVYWYAPAGSFIFNCSINGVISRGNKKDGFYAEGQVSQVQVDNLYTENNANHGLTLTGGSSGGLTNFQFNRLTLSLVPAGYAGLNLVYVSNIDVNTIYSEDVAGDNLRIRSGNGVRIVGGSIQQIASTSGGLVIGTDASLHPNKNILVDIPGWTKGAIPQKHVDLTQYPGGVTVNGLYLGRTADGALTSNNVNGYASVFYPHKIVYMYEDRDNSPTAAASSGAGTGGGVACTLSSTATDRKGHITLTHGSSAWGIGAQCRVTYNAPYSVAPVVTLQAENTTSANQVKTNGVSINSTTTYFEITFVTALSAQPAFAGTWGYTVTE